MTDGIWRPSRFCFRSIHFASGHLLILSHIFCGLYFTSSCGRLLFGPPHSDPGCDEPGQSCSSDAAAGGRRDDVKQVTDAAASGHPLHDRGYARAHTLYFYFPIMQPNPP